jgi:RNA polymerase sigma-70 factor (ECF subfamily)
MDVSQSVLASFFVRAATGEYDLERPEQLVGLLLTMARNKLASRARLERRQRRDIRRVVPTPSEGIADQHPSPAQALSHRELLEQFRNSLTDEERTIADLRGQGMAWDEVAQQLGGTGQARRMQLARGIDRVAEQLGLND